MEFDDTLYGGFLNKIMKTLLHGEEVLSYIFVDSDETLPVSSPTDRTGRLREFVVTEVDCSDESSHTQDTQMREEEYLEILDYIIAALGDLRLMLRDDARERKSRLVESRVDGRREK